MSTEEKCKKIKKDEKSYSLSLIFVIRPSTVVTIPPRVPPASSKSSSGILTPAVSDWFTPQLYFYEMAKENILFPKKK